MVIVVAVHGIQRFARVDPEYATAFFTELDRKMFTPTRGIAVKWSRLASRFVAIVPAIGFPGVHSAAMRPLRRVLRAINDPGRVILVGHSLGSRLAFDACALDHYKPALLVTAGSGPDLLGVGERPGFVRWPSRPRPPVPWLHVIRPADPWGASVPGPRVVELPDDGSRGIAAHESYWPSPDFAAAVARAWVRRRDREPDPESV